MTSAQLGSTKSGTCTAANGFKLDSDYGADKLNVDADASNTKAASAKKAASQAILEILTRQFKGGSGLTAAHHLCIKTIRTILLHYLIRYLFSKTCVQTLR